MERFGQWPASFPLTRPRAVPRYMVFRLSGRAAQLSLWKDRPALTNF
jgi:hypothetical protein